MIWVSLAFAASPTEEGWYLWETGQVDEVLARSRDALQADPSDIAMHRVWAYAQVMGARGEEPTKALYRSWSEADPDDPLPRVMLGIVTVWTGGREQGPWCDDAEAALSVATTDPNQTYYALRARYDLHAVCPGDQQADREALLALETPLARGYQLRIRMGHREVDLDSAWATDLEAFLAEEPSQLGSFGGAFWDQATGDGVERAREVLLDAAAAVLDSDDRVAVHGAARILRRANDDRAAEAERRLSELDPGAGALVVRHDVRDARWAPRDPWDQRLWWDVFRAQRKDFGAVRALTALDDKIPAEGPLRVAWLRYLAESYGSSLRGRTAREHWRLAFEAAPGDPQAALGWAEAAVWSGKELEEALAAVDRALDPPAWDPRNDLASAATWDDWRRARATFQARLLLARGKLLAALDRHDEALPPLRQALLLREDAETHLTLGLLYAETGQDEPALHHLGRGAAFPRPPDDRSLLRRGRREAERLYERLAWGPDFDSWLRAQAPVEEEPEAPAEPEDSTQAWRVGQTFPDLELSYNGEQTTLSAIGGVRVVDLWATWCGPCKASIPVLDEAAEQFAERGVTVLVVSVDRDRAAFERYRKFGKHHAIAYAGPEAMTLAKISGIPATFVLDAEGVVRAYHSGYRPDDDRLSKALEAVLAE